MFEQYVGWDYLSLIFVKAFDMLSLPADCTIRGSPDLKSFRHKT